MNKFQTVKRWFRNSWPFLRTAKEAEIEESDNNNGFFFEETPVESGDASAVLPSKNENDILMVEDNDDASRCCSNVGGGGNLMDEKFGERNLLLDGGTIAAKKQHDEDDNIIERSKEEKEEEEVVVAAYQYHATKSGSKSSSSSDGGDDYESKKAGSRVLDVTTAIMTSSSSKKEEKEKEEERLPRNNRGVQSRKSCRFQLLETTAEVVTEDSNENEATAVAPWTPNEITSLRNAYSECNPTSSTFWTDVSMLLLESSGRRRSAKECQRCWFGLVSTPKKRVYIKKKRVDNNKFDNDDDDIFDSTPLKDAVEAIEQNLPSYNNNDDNSDDDDKVVNNATTALNNMKSPLHKRPRMFSPKMNKTKPTAAAAAATTTTAGDNDKSSNNSSSSSRKVMSLSPVFNRRKGYNTYVNNLRKEITRAQRDKQKMIMTTKTTKGGDGGECNVFDDSSSSIVRVKEKRRVLAELDTSNGLFSMNVCHDDDNDESDDDNDDESGGEIGEAFWFG